MAPSRERVTVVIRTRNRPLLLERALDDVLMQSFRDWRLILVNDGGERAPVDAAVTARADRFAGRVDVVHIDGGTGSMEAAANVGAKRGGGEFVVIHDDDDTWHKDFLAETVRALEDAPAAVAASVLTEIVFEHISRTRVVETGRKLFEPPGSMITVFDLLHANRVVPISLLVRREVYDRIGWYDEELLAVGDWEFNLRLVQAGDILFLGDRPLAFWHQRPQAKGTHSNSIFGSNKDHAHFDRLVRDRALREHIDQYGAGALLYLTKFMDERMHYYSVGGTVRRVARRLLERFRFGRKGTR